jgi:hypothetical protein
MPSDVRPFHEQARNAELRRHLRDHNEAIRDRLPSTTNLRPEPQATIRLVEHHQAKELVRFPERAHDTIPIEAN